jgi:ATP-dependent protease ClpP protease subunit
MRFVQTDATDTNSTFLLTGVIADDTADYDSYGYAQGVQEVTKMLTAQKGKKTTIWLDTPGGSFFSGNSIGGVVNNLGGITAIGMGLVASAGTFILLQSDVAGLAESAMLMVHKSSESNVSGNADTFLEHHNVLNKLDGNIRNIMLQRIKKNKKMVNGNEKDTLAYIDSLLVKDTFMSAEEAFNAGLVDKVIPINGERFSPTKGQQSTDAATLSPNFQNAYREYLDSIKADKVAFKALHGNSESVKTIQNFYSQSNIFNQMEKKGKGAQEEPKDDAGLSELVAETKKQNSFLAKIFGGFWGANSAKEEKTPEQIQEERFQALEAKISASEKVQNEMLAILKGEKSGATEKPKAKAKASDVGIKAKAKKEEEEVEDDLDLEDDLEDDEDLDLEDDLEEDEDDFEEIEKPAAKSTKSAQAAKIQSAAKRSQEQIANNSGGKAKVKTWQEGLAKEGKFAAALNNKIKQSFKD